MNIASRLFMASVTGLFSTSPRTGDRSSHLVKYHNHHVGLHAIIFLTLEVVTIFQRRHPVETLAQMVCGEVLCSSPIPGGRGKRRLLAQDLAVSGKMRLRRANRRLKTLGLGLRLRLLRKGGRCSDTASCLPVRLSVVIPMIQRLERSPL